MFHIDCAYIIGIFFIGIGGGILNQQEISLLIAQIEIVGIIRAGNEIVVFQQEAFVPGIPVRGSIDYKALTGHGSSVKDPNTVKNCRLWITDAFGKETGCFPLPCVSAIFADCVIHLGFAVVVIGIYMEVAVMIKLHRAVSPAKTVNGYNTEFFKTVPVIGTFVNSVLVFFCFSEEMGIAEDQNINFALMIACIIDPTCIGT